VGTDTEYGVYGLYRPNGAICYVGKGRGNRPAQHFKNPDKHSNKHLGRIIKSAGGRLRVEWFSQGLTESDALRLEVKLIAEIGRTPAGPLVNLTDGGDGVSGMKHGPETRAKLSALSSGKVQSAETIAKRVAKLRGKKLPPRTAAWRSARSALITGRKLSEEQKAKISAAHLGQKRSVKARLSMSKAQRGHAVTDQARANMSIAHQGKKQSAELIEKRAATLRGRKRAPYSAEWRENMSKAAKVRMARKSKVEGQLCLL
jgi:hypothetical protein